MTLKQYLFLMFLSTAVLWFGWFMIVISVDPMSANLLSFFVFYLTLGLSLCGTVSIIGVLVRSYARRHDPPARHVADAFRQSILLSALFTIGLLLQARGRLSTMNLAFLIGILAIFELFLVSFKPRQ
jgi:hypothetical protein